MIKLSQQSNKAESSSNLKPLVNQKKNYQLKLKENCRFNKFLTFKKSDCSQPIETADNLLKRCKSNSVKFLNLLSSVQGFCVY